MISPGLHFALVQAGRLWNPPPFHDGRNHPPRTSLASRLARPRANLLPGLLLQITALLVVVAYYHHAPTRAAFEQLTALRAATGYAFGIVSTGFCGGLLPFLYLRTLPAYRHQYTWRQGLWLTAFWAYKGLEVEAWYRLLAHLVGTGHDLTTIVIKTLLDEGVYCPILAVPLTVVVYYWNAKGFSCRFTTRRSPGGL